MPPDGSFGRQSLASPSPAQTPPFSPYPFVIAVLGRVLRIAFLAACSHACVISAAARSRVSGGRRSGRDDRVPDLGRQWSRSQDMGSAARAMGSTVPRPCRYTCVLRRSSSALASSSFRTVAESFCRIRGMRPVDSRRVQETKTRSHSPNRYLFRRPYSTTRVQATE